MGKRNQISTEVVREEDYKQSEQLKEPLALGSVFALSGMFPDVKTQAQAVVKILAGRELGIAPLESMTNIYFVNARRGITAQLAAARIKTSGKYDYAVDKLDDSECTISFYNGTTEERKKIGVSTFTTKDAAKAGLINKDNWKNYPRNCLFARALSNGARWFCPDVNCGYIIEELTDLPEKSNVIEIKKGKVTLNGET